MTVLAATTATQPSTIGSAAASSTTRTTGSTSLGQADFLRLLTAQLSQQDPLNPLDNNAFVAQMAQFSQVSGLAEINQSLSAITSLMRGNSSGALAGWIGHSALIDGDSAMPLDDGDVHGVLAAGQPARGVVLNLADATGNVVASRSLGDLAPGDHGFTITPPAGVTGPFRITTGSAAGSSPGSISTWTQILGVRSPAAGADARLITPVGDADPASIRRIG